MLIPFQKKVYNMVKRIPGGRVATYREIARILGNPGLARAVGNALNKNPWPEKIPCHRVIKVNRKLGSYKWGTIKKKRLLEKEGIKFDKSGKIKREYILTEI